MPLLHGGPQRKHKDLSVDAPSTVMIWRDIRCIVGHFLGDLNLGERHSRLTWDDGTVTLCALRAATVLSLNCCADCGRPSTKKAMSHSRGSPGVTAPLRTNTVPLAAVWNPPLPLLPP